MWLFCVLKCGRKLVDSGFKILVSIVVSIPACHAGDPGSIPGRGAFCLFPYHFGENVSMATLGHQHCPNKESTIDPYGQANISTVL